MSDNLPILSGPFDKPSAGKANKLVIFLHGLGANGDDLFSLVPYFKTLLPQAYFISPDAPFPCDMSPFGKQWFSLQMRDENNILAGVNKVSPIINKFIDDKLSELSLSDKDLILIGFSQGAMLSMHVGLRRKNQIGAIIAYSGALIAPRLLDKQILSKPPICLIHGEADMVVPFVAFNDALNALKRNNVSVQGYSSKNLGHGIDPYGIKIALNFIKETMAETL